MTLHIKLSPELEGSIEAKLTIGPFGNATEVIGDAVRRMQAEEGHAKAFRAAVMIGDDELDRGESRPYTPEVLEEISRKAPGRAIAFSAVATPCWLSQDGRVHQGSPIANQVQSSTGDRNTCCRQST